VCSLRIACNTRRKNGSTGEWEDKPNYFNVTVWGAQGENAARYLTKGRPVAIDGRLEWREWEAQDGSKRQAVDIIAESVQFLGSREGGSQGNGSASGLGPAGTGSDVSIDEQDFQPASIGVAGAPGESGEQGSDDDIPF
jgi:single-strand DNA-binding protein